MRRALLIFLFLPLAAFGQSSFEDLLLAINKGDVKAVSEFLDKGLDVNTADTDGNTLLMNAARLGHRDVVHLLIERRASVTRRSPHGDTALMFASLKGHLEIVQLLADKGAEVKHETWRWAPIHYAAFEGRNEVLKFLLRKGADKNAQAPNGYSALMLAVRGEHLDAVRTLLFDDVEVNLRAPGGENAFGLAKAAKNKEIVELLKRAGAVD